MPKNTFNNLPPEKREKIYEALREEFNSNPFNKASVKNIVENLNISRGSFYQYFEDLEESYFTILLKETTDIHSLFIEILKDDNFDLCQSLEKFGNRISNLIFDERRYSLYKYRFLYWNEDLEKRWIEFYKKQAMECKHHSKNCIDNIDINYEKVNFVKAVIHNIIKRAFQENFSKEAFLVKYNQYVNWIIKGVD
ncbi:TetR/AcrR family transcriptional regulator [Peptostreptococcus sp. D1]|uniref:TetR/AcrR family transcriptional regulator n=1 Tax=Peptostreptococcus sp. D1 TaxID=72304 RepID=UPI0008EB98E9|nr:TetR/AcrR family transcriptional regulator [Peptostreptococcus sp. D1]SFE28191.1 transcriptional regulator, TetR family [Peptostreptococcus sp. D1]